MNIFKILPESILKRLVQNIAQHSHPAFDVAVARNNTQAAFWRLKSLGFSPKTIWDIGAFEGKWSAQIASIFPDASFHLFEALPAKAPIILKNTQNLKRELHTGLLGSTNKDGMPYYALESGSGVYAENTDIQRTMMELPMRRLDEFMRVDEGDKPLLMKLDVQGYELEVLKGAGSLLDSADALYLELSTVDYNAGAPSFSEVISTLHQWGFALYDLGEMHRKGSDHSLLQVDGLFLRETGRWYQQASDLSGPITIYTD